MRQKIKIQQMRALIKTVNDFLGEYDPKFAGKIPNELCLGTGIQEGGNYSFIKQYTNNSIDGVGCSYWQVEPATHNDNWQSYLKYRPELAKKFLILAGERIIFEELPEVNHEGFIKNYIENERYKSKTDDVLIHTLPYAIAHCRLWYYRQNFKMPEYFELEEIANIWKTYYNTKDGAGTVEEFIHNYENYAK